VREEINAFFNYSGSKTPFSLRAFYPQINQLGLTKYVLDYLVLPLDSLLVGVKGYTLGLDKLDE
jgi:hypothetical protein